MLNSGFGFAMLLSVCAGSESVIHKLTKRNEIKKSQKDKVNYEKPNANDVKLKDHSSDSLNFDFFAS